MTIDELLAREGIRKTMAKCAQAGDSLRAAEYAACFAEHGVLQTEGAGGERHLRIEGRAAILAWQEGWRRGSSGAAAAAPSARFVRHNLTTSQIALTGPDTARARTYFFVLSGNGPDHAGVYTDDFVRAGDEWLIVLRRVRTEWNAADSLFVAPPGDAAS